MSCLVFKKCCGFKLPTGSLIIGYIVLVQKVIWLYFCSQDIYNSSKNFPNLKKSIQRLLFMLSVINEVTLILENVFAVLLLLGLYKKKLAYLRAFYQPSAICFVIDCAVFILKKAYLGLQFTSISNLVMFINEIFTKLITPYFLLVVRSHYLQSGDIGSIFNMSLKHLNLSA